MNDGRPAPRSGAHGGSQHGPRVVAIGGGHGLAAALSAARRYAGEITAVVSVADDGGSSGRLRDCFGIPPPGDLRRCLVALASEQSVWSRAFEHRFDAGELSGHSLGNLVIAGLAATTGDYLGALEEAGRLLKTVGRVLPATSVPVVLKAVTAQGVVEGQVAVMSSHAIQAVSLVPADPQPPPPVLDAILAADQIVIGPGSLYTSVLAVLAVPAIGAALAAATAQLVYVCNLAVQQPETEGYDVAAHLAAVLAHGVAPDVVLCDSSTLPVGEVKRPVVDTALAAPGGRAHDPARLAAALARLAP